MRKLFIGGLSYSTDDASLREAFSRYGEVEEGALSGDHRTTLPPDPELPRCLERPNEAARPLSLFAVRCISIPP